MEGLYFLESTGLDNMIDVDDQKTKFGVQIVDLHKRLQSDDCLFYYRKLNYDRDNKFINLYNKKNGEVAERLKALVLKTSNGATRSWVRIPPSPPLNLKVFEYFRNSIFFYFSLYFFIRVTFFIEDYFWFNLKTSICKLSSHKT